MPARDFAAETAAAKEPGAARDKVLQALQSGRLGVSFSGSAFGSAYQLGAAHMLHSLGLLDQHTPVGGTSAGGIVAVAVRCGIPYTDVLSGLKQASNDLLQHGFKKRIRSVLQPVLDKLLPPDAHDRCNNSPSVVLSATQIKGPCPACLKGTVLDEPFSSRDDLVQRLLVAVHEPKETDGRLCVRYHRRLYADGGMRLPVPPIPAADYSIIVYPVPNRLLKRVWPYKIMMHPPAPEAIAISPGQYRPWPYSNSYKKSDDLVMHPQPPEVLDMLFERGRRDALSWARHVGLVGGEPAATTAGRGPASHPANIKPMSGVGEQLLIKGHSDERDLSPSGAFSDDEQQFLEAPVQAKQQQGSVLRLSTSKLQQLQETPVEQLPTIVPVPGNLLHML